MWASFLLLGISTSLALAQDSFNCAKFWPSIKPGERFTVDAECHMYPGYPQTIGQTTVSVVYTNEWQGNLGIIDALLNEAITQSVAFYGNLAPVPDMVIILGAQASKAALDAGFPTFPDGPCQIRSFEGWAANEAVAMSPTAMQAVAHEIYHCVQESILGDRPGGSPSGWVIESSADYFSNLVFPQANREWDSSMEYLPELPIYKQTYNASLWFQAMEGSRGMVYLQQFVTSTVFAADEDSERGRLAGYSTFADDFFLFAKDFTFNRITDTGGGVVPIQNFPEKRNVIWSVNEDETEGTAVIEAATFTIAQFTMAFEPGQNIKLYSSAKGNQRVAWRLQSQVYWSDLPSGGSSGGSEGIIEIPCASGPATVRVLFISTESKATDKVDLSYIQQYKDENCCKKGGKRDLKACPTSAQPEPTSSAPEPTGTGSCTGSDIPMDPCLTKGGWSLDIPSTRALMKKRLSELPEITINNVQVSGAGGLSFDKSKASFTYTHLVTNIDISAEGLNLPVSVDITGKASGRFFIKSGGKGSGKACLAFTSGAGTATAQLPFIGEQVFDLAPGGGYLYDMDVDYTCSGGKMTIMSAGSQDFTGGAPGWGPFSYNAA
ncbi:hypothetical protein NM208_g3722 [Fusarium decemcellulare]|uniref:Uncharacterized protein n=1 Tax=Fusarium decemcellulare TaxID=57161 RepID=A0ACC1SNF2_9HYPO|nr:hypothetical protein NM208_g3722 [Fusarium decemcellulare]